MKLDYDLHSDLISYFNRSTRERRMASELQGLAAAWVWDGALDDGEIQQLLSWMDSNAELGHHWPFDRLFSIARAAVADGVVDQSERSALFTYLDAIAAAAEKRGLPADNIFDDIEGVVVEGCSFAVTGKLNYGPRRELVAKIEDHGGEFHKAVRGDTDYLVCGDLGSGDWITSRYGTKIQRVMDLRKAGGNSTMIIREVVMLSALNE